MPSRERNRRRPWNGAVRQAILEDVSPFGLCGVGDVAVDNGVHHLCKTVPILCAYWGNTGEHIAEPSRNGTRELVKRASHPVHRQKPEIVHTPRRESNM